MCISLCCCLDYEWLIEMYVDYMGKEVTMYGGANKPTWILKIKKLIKNYKKK